jgi:hypothetical protein
MEIKYPVDHKPATPEYVLAVLNSHYCFSCQVSFGAEPHEPLTFDTTVSDWRAEAELLPWPRIEEAHNEYWEINCAQEEWRAVLIPERKRTLRDVCELIAARAMRPVVRPSEIFGSRCLPAGVFLTLRSRLQEAGIDVAGLRPSTPLEGFMPRHAYELLDATTRLTPGAIEKVSWFAPARDASFGIFLLSAGCLLLNFFTDSPWFTIVGVAGMVVGYLWSWIAVRWIGPQRVEFDSLETFGDLSRRIAERLQTGAVS